MDSHQPSETAPKAPRRGVLRFGAGLFRFLMKTALVLMFVAGGLFIGGLLNFATSISDHQSTKSLKDADGIVVLTGGRHRISHALDLVSARKGKRLLISGVNADTSKNAIGRLNPTKQALFTCCVDVERQALDTIGNARESAKWAQANDMASLIVVTSSYHMPRSMLEFRRALPETKLQASAVIVPELADESWWRTQKGVRLVVSEYVKYIAAIVRPWISQSAVTALRASLASG